MYMGEFSHSLDSKGRMTIPAKFRNSLGERFVVTRSLDNCLCIYDMNSWEKFSEQLSSLAYSVKDQRTFTRFFFSGEAEVEPDKMGRILIPQALRAAAKIEKDVVLVGAGSRVEIWSKDVWEEALSSDAMSDIAEAMAEKGIMI
ncbi:MAG: division/cell wall cluster transcriptional repressor MraZ [Lachnospiraceae bacterium]|nr:division/cell wall cluster transcriptional repressor MraZ [Lachnospiraceae bacterium]